MTTPLADFTLSQRLPFHRLLLRRSLWSSAQFRAAKQSFQGFERPHGLPHHDLTLRFDGKTLPIECKSEVYRFNDDLGLELVTNLNPKHIFGLSPGTYAPGSTGRGRLEQVFRAYDQHRHPDMGVAVSHHLPQRHVLSYVRVSDNRRRWFVMNTNKLRPLLRPLIGQLDWYVSRYNYHGSHAWVTVGVKVPQSLFSAGQPLSRSVVIRRDISRLWVKEAPRNQLRYDRKHRPRTDDELRALGVLC